MFRCAIVVWFIPTRRIKFTSSRAKYQNFFLSASQRKILYLFQTPNVKWRTSPGIEGLTSLLLFLHASNQVKVTRCDRQTWPSALSFRPWDLVVRGGDLSGTRNHVWCRIYAEAFESIQSMEPYPKVWGTIQKHYSPSGSVKMHPEAWESIQM